MNSNIFKISGALVIGKFSTANAPANPAAGYIYYDTTLNQYRMYDVSSSSFQRVELNILIDSMAGNQTDKAPSVSSVKSHVSAAVSAETSRAASVESNLTTSINNEISRATSAEGSLSTLISTSVSSEASLRTSADSSLDTKISNETSRAESAEASLNTSVSTETSRATSAEGSLSTLISTSVSSETSRAESAESSLDTKISTSVSTETSRAASAESSLSTLISTSVSSETSRAESAESSLSSQISAEVSRAQSAEASLAAGSSGLSTETSRAESAEASLDAKISSEESRATSAESSLTSRISTEESRAASAEASLDTKVSSETSRAESAEASLDTKISAETSSRLSADSSLDTKVSAETSRATSAESSLDSKISAETSRATSAENALDGALDTLNSDLSNEVSRATSAETSLNVKVSTETSRAQSTESSLSSQISTEISRATSTEASLANAVSSVDTKLSSETSRAESAESSLSTLISTSVSVETSRAGSAESSLDTKISAETSRATSAESSLDTKISAETSRATSSESSLATLANSKLALAGGTMSGNIDMNGNIVTGLKAPTDSTDAVRKSYVDALVSGTTWLDPILDPDLFDDKLSSPPVSPTVGAVYIVAGSASGLWAGLEGHALFYSGTGWVDLLERAVQAGDRFGVSFYLGAAGSSGSQLIGKDDYVAQIVSATPGSITYSFTAPAAGKAVYVNEITSTHFGHSYLYSADTSAWIEFGGPGAINAGTALSWSGNTLNVNLGKGVTSDSNKIATDLYTAGALEHVDPSTGSPSSADDAQVSIKLDGSTLSKSSSGLKVNSIADAQIASNAAITLSKLAALTASKALVSDASGVIIASSVTATELGYLSGVTSAIQTQINGKLANVVEDTTPELGGNLDVNGKAIEGASSDIVLAGQNSVKRAKQASKASFIEEEYIHAVSLLASQTDTVASAFTFAHATVEALEITYKIKDSANKVRIGTLRVVSNGSDISYVDTYAETADLQISWIAAINGTDVELKYTSDGNTATMRADVKKILA